MTLPRAPAMENVRNEIYDFFQRMGFGNDIETVEIHDRGTCRLCVRVKNSPSAEHENKRPLHVPQSHMLIGERGSTLAAIEYVIKRIVRKKYKDAQKFTLDINDYRVRRLEDLKQDIKTAAKAVRMYQREVPLRPMPSFERRIVHLLLAEYPDITTHSIGQEPERRVVIKPYP